MSTVVKKKKEKKQHEYKLPGLVNVVFSWSLADVINKDLYKNEVKQIPDKFCSPHDYLTTFVNPLIEETHADICSSMMSLSSSPKCQISSVKRVKGFQPPKGFLYVITVKRKAGREKKESIYEPKSGDLLALTNSFPKCIDDLSKPTCSYTVAIVQRSMRPGRVRIISSKPILFTTQGMLFSFYLTNLTTNIRIWDGLHPGEGGYIEFIKAVASYDPSTEEDCVLCLSTRMDNINLSKTVEAINTRGLDESQRAAVANCIALTECHHRHGVKLIWGPPGTGKTNTIALHYCVPF